MPSVIIGRAGFARPILCVPLDRALDKFVAILIADFSHEFAKLSAALLEIVEHIVACTART